MGKKNKNKTNNQDQPQNITQTENINQTEQIIPNVPNSNNIVNISIPMICIPEAEYKSMNNEKTLLMTENDKLNKEIDTLRKDMMIYCENERLLKETIKHNEQTIEVLREENKKLKIEVEELKKKNEEIIKKLDYLMNKNELFEALSKLNDCDKLANDAFKKEYRKYFNKNKYDNNIPNLGQFIDNAPDSAIDKDDYDFWLFFCKKYPNSDNKDFRDIYKKISNERVQHGAHHKITDIGEIEFDKLMKIALPDVYTNNKKLCDDYRKWLYLF